MSEVEHIFFQYSGTKVSTHIHYIHSDHELNIVMKGSCRYLLDNENEVILHTGDILLLPGGCQHQMLEIIDANVWGIHVSPQKLINTINFYTSTRERVTFISQMHDVLLPQQQTFDEMLELLSQYPSPFNAKVIHNPGVHQTLCEMFSLIEEEYNHTEVLYSTYINIISNMIAVILIRLLLNTSTANNQVNESMQMVIEVKKWLDRNYHKQIAIPELAEKANLSRAQFCRIFHKYTGQSPKEYLIRLRLRHAIRRLLETNLPVTQIANESGFNDPANFFQAFKMNYGTSPNNYRIENSQITAKTDDMVNVYEYKMKETE